VPSPCTILSPDLHFQTRDIETPHVDSEVDSEVATESGGGGGKEGGVDERRRAKQVVAVVSCVEIRHIIYIDKSCHVWEYDISYISISHVTCGNT